MRIGFNKPYCSGRETDYIADAVKREKISGDGHYTRLCHRFFENKYLFKKVFLTSSCTDALEMAAILLDIQPGDEVIIPSYTFVSSANPFILRGAKIIFADCQPDLPNLDEQSLEPLITDKTKVIVAVHYAGVACRMDEIMALAKKHNLFVVEDAAQAIDSYYKGKALGGIGHIGCLSFHETKNITSGEGGLLVINDERFITRAEIIWEKGTNRSAFFRGEVSKYGWMDIGSSFLPSELTAAFLFAQLENLDLIQARRKKIWEYYYNHLNQLVGTILPLVPGYAYNNAHMFYLVCKNLIERNKLITRLEEKGIQAISHYLPLHLSNYFEDKHDGRLLNNAVRFSHCIIRLPFYFQLSFEEQDCIVDEVKKFFAKESNYVFQDPAVHQNTMSLRSSVK